MPDVIFRTLTREYRLHAGTAAIADAFAFMAIRPEIVGVKLKPVELILEGVAGFWRLRLPDGSLVEGSASHLIRRLHGLIFSDTVESEPGALLIHCATLVLGGRRIALIGDKGSGKSTLALQLLSRGFDIEGDEHLVARSTGVIARPRTLRIKASSLHHVPALAETIRRAPSIRNWDGTAIFAVDPSITGRTWRISEGGLDALVFIDANHGGRTVMSPLAGEAVFRSILQQTVIGTRNVPVVVGRLRQLSMATPAFVMQLGDAVGAERHLRHLAAERLAT